MDYAPFLRAKNVHECPVGALALYLFAMYECEQFAFPNVEDVVEKAWYSSFLFFTENEQTRMKYNTEYAAMKAGFKFCNIASKKYTHATRSSGAIVAEANGASELAIRRLGNWQTSIAETCYMNAFPMEAIKAQAGFDPKNDAIYYPRAATEVPNALWGQIFVSIEPKLEALARGGNKDISAKCFLVTLRKLSRILIQDSVFLKEKHPKLFCWNHPVFNRYESNSVLQLASSLCILYNINSFNTK